MNDSPLVVVQVPAYLEPGITETFDAIAGQERPEGWQVKYEAWVTMDARGNDTWLEARSHPYFEAFEAPPGKLASRNAAHDHAFELGADAVVCWDADATPARNDVLVELLKPLSEGADAVNGNPMPPGITPIALMARIGSVFQEIMFPHINGQLHALTPRAWEVAGPFDTDIDQTDSHAVRAEEEFGFYRRIKRHGEVGRAPRAIVYEEPRRTILRMNRAFNLMTFGGYPLDTWEQERGETTFLPEQE